MTQAWAFAVLFVALWIAVSALIGAVSGWRRLAMRYPEVRPFTGQLWRFQSGRMRNAMGYNNCLTVGADGLGLHLSVLFLFRVGHAPVFVPWGAVRVSPERWLFLRRFRLDFRDEPGVSLAISDRLAERLKTAAGSAWPAARA